MRVKVETSGETIGVRLDDTLYEMYDMKCGLIQVEKEVAPGLMQFVGTFDYDTFERQVAETLSAPIAAALDEILKTYCGKRRK